MLEVHDLAVVFGGVAALRNVSFSIEDGGIFGLMGPNGAGKSTFINCVTGNVASASGSVRWQGEVVTGRRAEHVAQFGIARTYQHARLFRGLTALENVMVGGHLRGKSGVFDAMMRTPRWRRDESSLKDASLAALSVVHASDLAEATTEELTAGQQRLVAVARSLVSNPGLLLLDEPAAGLTDAETNLLAQDLLEYSRNHGATVLIVEHNVGFLFSLASRIVVFDRGAVIAEGRPDEIRTNSLVIAAYLGSERAAS